MSYDEMVIILDVIDALASYRNTTCLEKSIDERGIRVLKTVVKGLYTSDDGRC